MKKKNIINFLWIALISLLLMQCESMTDTYQKYIDEGEKLYLGKTDSLIAMPGIGRIKLKWYVNSDPKIEETIIYWNMRQDSVVKTFQRKEEGMQTDSIIIEGLAEGLYTFELYNRNVRGDRSLFSSVQGEVYGENFISGLKNRAVASTQVIAYDKDKQTSDVEVTWGPSPKGSLGSKITYNKRSSGEFVEVLAAADQTSITIYDVGNRLNNPDDMLEITTLYQFDNSIDILETKPQKEQICVFSASGVRKEYNTNGTLERTIQFDNLIKILRRVSSLSTTVAYDCNRVAESSSLPNTFFRFTLKENNINVEGYYNGLLNTISDYASSTFSPVEQKLTLHYKYVKTDGSYSIIEEELVTGNTSFPVLPKKVYSFGSNKNGHFFTKDDDLIHVDVSGNMWLYRFNEDKSFDAPSLITTEWANFTSVFYLPNNRIFRYDGYRVDIMTIDDGYNVIALAWYVGAGWTPLNINRLMPFKDFALIMTNTSGVLLKLGINASNGWVGGFDQIATGFEAYRKIIPFGNTILAIDNSGGLWHMTLSDNFELGVRTRIGSGWNKYIDVINQGSGLLAIDENGDMWSYDFNPDLSWNVN